MTGHARRMVLAVVIASAALLSPAYSLAPAPGPAVCAGATAAANGDTDGVEVLAHAATPSKFDYLVLASMADAQGFSAFAYHAPAVQAPPQESSPPLIAD